MSDAQRKRLLKVRSRINRQRPKFRQYESWRYVRVKDHWRKPVGIDNKMRFNLKGWPRSVNVGWRGPAEVRGIHPSGLEEVMVWNVADLGNVNPQEQAARIGGTVGAKKREAIKEKAAELEIRILNAGIEKQADEFEELKDEEPEAPAGGEEAKKEPTDDEGGAEEEEDEE